MRNRTPLVLAALLAAATLQAATPIVIPDPAPGDLTPVTLVSAADLPQLVAPSREPVQFAWALPSGVIPDAAPRRHTATSRGYTLRVTSRELASGVTLHTTAPGAVVRINPVRTASTDELVALDPSRVQVIPQGDRSGTGPGAIPLATAEQLAQAGVPFPEGSSAFRIDPGLGAGTFTLRAPDLGGEASAPWVVAVVEPESPVTLELTADALAYLPGMRGTATAVLGLEGSPLTGTVFEARLVAPDGSSRPVAVTGKQDGTARIAFDLDRLDAAAQGLWEIHLTATGTFDGLTARRDVRTAFGYALPTARLTGEGSLEMRDGGVAVSIGVEAGAPGRYGVSAVLWGRGDDGALHPAAVAQSAAWLEPGIGSLELVFDADVIAASGLRAPWELQNLELRDQGRLGILEVRPAGPALDLPAPKEDREGGTD